MKRATLDEFRAVTPGSGAYMNEGDPEEPDCAAELLRG